MRIFAIVKCFLLLRGDAEHSEAEVCLPAQEEPPAYRRQASQEGNFPKQKQNTNP